jgi:sRNA-binding carbon storage regulator CsrA
MFVMSRKRREGFVVGGATGFDRLLKVTVIEVQGDNVKLGIEVADDVPVRTWEAWRRLCGEMPEPAGAAYPGTDAF